MITKNEREELKENLRHRIDNATDKEHKNGIPIMNKHTDIKGEKE